jgi:hybrid polyketide synthase / nonribosomal peptide synthetase ACE1
VLVDLLRSANICFDAVVGHSFKEIAAAYAAGYLSAKHALYIAYYHRFHAKYACESGDAEGAMLAVATFLENAKEFCGLGEFQGRITIAASNSF